MTLERRLLLALSMICTPLAAQQRAALPARHDTLVVRYGETVIGRGVLQWSRNGSELLQVYVWTSAMDGVSVTDSLFADASTLLPRREVRVLGDTTVVVEFGPGSLRVRTVAAGRDVEADSKPLPRGLFSSASIEALAASMPLETGATSRVAVFYAPPAKFGTRDTEIRVVGSEVLAGRSAWRVEAATVLGGTTFWIDAATRTVLQSDTREGDALITFRR